MKEVLIVYLDDYIGMYIDGKLKREDSQIDLWDLPVNKEMIIRNDKRLDSSYELEEYYEDTGGLPKTTTKLYEIANVKPKVY